MAELWKDGFDHYGVGANARLNMLNGPWADIATGLFPEVPSFGARTGPNAIRLNGSGTLHTLRRTLGGAHDDLYISLGLYLPQLPVANNDARIVHYRDSGNNTITSFSVTTVGGIDFRTGDSGSVLVSSASGVVSAGTWHHIECRMFRNASTGIFDLRVDGVQVINGTGLNTGAVNIEQLNFGKGATVITAADFWIDDVIVRDETGTRNNGFEGDLRVFALYPNMDTAAAGWTPRFRKKIGAGILDNRANNNSAISAADDADFEFGQGDYTIEAFVRFEDLPTGSNKAVIMGKWQESGNHRSWQLFKGGPSLNSGALVFRISTDGQAGTVTNIHEWPWEPDTGVWYHLAVVRDSSDDNYLFIDGIQQGGKIADANDYDAGDAALCVGGEMSSATLVIANTGFDGFMDEVRITKGVARYTADFTPTTVAFGRNTTDDTDYNSVELLAGFDNSIEDESSTGRTLTARNGAVMHTPDDGDNDYETINQADPRDDTFMEAALLFAKGTLELTANPSDGETVKLSSVTYTFRDTISVANDVHIGTDADESLTNLISAINDSGVEGTDYGTGTLVNPDVSATALPGDFMLATAKTAGSAGNSLDAEETLTNGNWDAAVTGNSNNLAGGADIPSVSEFGVDRAPANTTIIKSVTVINRSFKSDSGTANVQTGFVGPLGAVHLGTDNPLTTSPTYREDIHDTDPDTSSDLTPSTIAGAKVRLDRTA